MERVIGFEPMYADLQSAALILLAIPAGQLGIGTSDFGFTLLVVSDKEIPNPKSQIQMWFRGKDSNLYLLVQSQPSCRLDDPE